MMLRRHPGAGRCPPGVEADDGLQVGAPASQLEGEGAAEQKPMAAKRTGRCGLGAQDVQPG